MSSPTAAGKDIPPLPRTGDAILQRGEQVGMPVNDACMPGVVANMALLDRHAATLLDRPESAQP